MNRTDTPAALILAVFVMFALSAYQLLEAQKPQYVPDLGDDAGATCCIGREACEVEEHPPSPSCFYATDHGALPTWYECVAPICDAWPNTTCWADAAKARHEMGWGGAYEACDYDSNAAVNIAKQCFTPESGDSCVGDQFHACVADRCRLWDGSARNCEEDADEWVHGIAAGCDTPSSTAPYGPALESLDFADKEIIAFTAGVKRASPETNPRYHPVKATADREKLIQLGVLGKAALADIDAYIALPGSRPWTQIRPRVREIDRGIDGFAIQLSNTGTGFIPEEAERKLQNMLNEPVLLPPAPASKDDQNNLVRIRSSYAQILAHIDEAVSELNNYLKRADLNREGKANAN